MVNSTQMILPNLAFGGLAIASLFFDHRPTKRALVRCTLGWCEGCKYTKLYSENWRIFITNVSQIFCLNLHRFLNKHFHGLMILLRQYIFETVTLLPADLAKS